MAVLDPMRIQEIADRVLERCDVLAQCSDSPDGISRGSFSGAMQRAHAHVQRWMEEAGLAVRVDAAGNIVGRRPAVGAAGRSAVHGAERSASEAAPRTLLIGSHLDSVANAGRYDGVIGVLLGVAVAEALAERVLPFHLDVIGFSDEDGLRFGSTYFGSLAVSGRFPQEYMELRDAEGTTLRQAIAEFGLDPEAIPDAAYSREELVGFIEAHIEQGPILHAQRRALGVCEAIVGQGRYELTFRGRAAHVGTTPMGLRRDAGVGAAEFLCAVERSARTHEGIVGTVGDLRFHPGASNVVPETAQLSLDLRGPDDALRTGVRDELFARAEEIATERGLALSRDTLLDRDRQPLDRSWCDSLLEQTQGLRMVSGAGHDAAIMASHTKSALLFLRNPDGISHHPDEAVVPGDLPAMLAELCSFVDGLAAEERSRNRGGGDSGDPAARAGSEIRSGASGMESSNAGPIGGGPRASANFEASTGSWKPGDR